MRRVWNLEKFALRWKHVQPVIACYASWPQVSSTKKPMQKIQKFDEDVTLSTF